MVTGNWEVIIATPMGKMEIMVDLEANGNELTGVINSKQNKNVPIKDGKVNGNDVSFSASIKTPLGSTDVTVTATVDGDSMAGQMITKFGAVNVTASRQG